MGKGEAQSSAAIELPHSRVGAGADSQTRPRWPERGLSGQQYWSHQPLGGHLLVQGGEVPGGCSGTSATHCILSGPTRRAGVSLIRMLPLVAGRCSAACQRPLGGWQEGERSGLVHYPPSTWHEKRFPVEVSCFLEANCHATWARPQLLGSQSAREELRKEEPRGWTDQPLLPPFPGDLAPSSGQCEKARGQLHFIPRTITFTYFRSPIRTKYSLFISTLTYSAAVTSPFSRPPLSSQWLLPLGFSFVNQRVP